MMNVFKVEPDDFIKIGAKKGKAYEKPRWSELWDLKPGEAVEAWSKASVASASVSLSLAKRRRAAPPFIKCGRLKDGRSVYYNPGE